MTEVVAATEESIRRAAGLLAAGELVCFPTETVYGVGANASDPAAVGRVFAAKGRPADHPLIVHLPDAQALPEWAGTVPEAAERLAAAFWPGPLTLVLPRGARVSDAVTGGQPTVALRVPGHPVALELVERFGSGVAAPSANRFGRVSPTRAEHAAAELGRDVALVLDGGPCSVGLESTIIDLSGDRPRLLRPGGLSRERIETALGVRLDHGGRGDAPRAPGTLSAHYAPSSPLRLLQRERLHELADSEVTVSVRPVILAFSSRPSHFRGEWVQMPADPQEYARALYYVLRRVEGQGGEILVEVPPSEAEWEAVNDRLRRAAVGSGGSERR